MTNRTVPEKSLLIRSTLRRARGFSLVELMVGLTIGFIAVAVIIQSLSVFGSHARTTTAGADAQESGLLGLMSIENDIRKAAVGFNHPDALSCRNFYSYYLVPNPDPSAPPPSPISLGDFPTLPVVISDAAKSDIVSVQHGMRIEGAAPALVWEVDHDLPDRIEFDLRRAYDLVAGNPLGSVVLMVNPETGSCALMAISSSKYSDDKVAKEVKVTVQNGLTGAAPEYNAPIAYMQANNWPGYGSEAGRGFFRGSLAFQVGNIGQGGVRSVEFSVDANNSLQTIVTGTGVAETTTVANEIVALQAQYGVSANVQSKEISAWVDPVGAWASAALKASTPAAIQSRQRIKAIRVAIVARSGQRDGGLVTQACVDNNATNYGPCAWTDDTSANPAPAIDLRASAADTEWQHYRYRVYQTVIPMRNLMWPNLGG